VHLAHIGHPILGDATYGTGFKTKAGLLSQRAQAALGGLGRQALHAYLLAIEHPQSRESLLFQLELAGDLRRLRDALAAQSPGQRRQRRK
jgi:23S rRNA pseudouridine1911/1915/1917 synthase